MKKSKTSSSRQSMRKRAWSGEDRAAIENEMYLHFNHYYEYYSTLVYPNDEYESGGSRQYEGDGIPFDVFRNDSRFQDDETWAFPYGLVNAIWKYEKDGVTCTIAFDTTIEEGKVFVDYCDAYVDGKGDRFIYNDFDIARYIGNGCVGGAKCIFDSYAEDNVFEDAIIESGILEDFAYAIVERNMYEEVMGRSGMRKSSSITDAQIDA